MVNFFTTIGRCHEGLMRLETISAGVLLTVLFTACSSDSAPSHGSDSEPSQTAEVSADAGRVASPAGATSHDAGKPASPVSPLDAGGFKGPTAQDASMAATAPGIAVGDAALAADASASPETCDHACLMAMLDDYLKALVAHDPTKTHFASTLKYTDNGVLAKLGDGLWKTASSIRDDTRLLFADPVTGNAALMLVVLEGTTPVLYQARVKVASHEITELETMTVRRAGAANGFFSPDGMVPKPVFLEPVPANKRMTRDALKAEVDLYVDFLDGASGSKVHFDPQCVRFENGVQTAQAGAVGAQSWNFMVTRRFLVIDEEQGIVYGMFPFTQADTTLVVGEAFKVEDMKIKMIQAVMANMPAKTWN